MRHRLQLCCWRGVQGPLRIVRVREAITAAAAAATVVAVAVFGTLARFIDVTVAGTAARFARFWGGL